MLSTPKYICDEQHSSIMTAGISRRIVTAGLLIIAIGVFLFTIVGSVGLVFAGFGLFVALFGGLVIEN